MAAPKIKVGDRYLAEVEVTRVSDDDDYVTIKFPGFGTPISVYMTTFDMLVKPPK